MSECVLEVDRCTRIKVIENTELGRRELWMVLHADTQRSSRRHIQFISLEDYNDRGFITLPLDTNDELLDVTQTQSSKQVVVLIESVVGAQRLQRKILQLNINTENGVPSYTCTCIPNESNVIAVAGADDAVVTAEKVDGSEATVFRKYMLKGGRWVGGEPREVTVDVIMHSVIVNHERVIFLSKWTEDEMRKGVKQHSFSLDFTDQTTTLDYEHQQCCQDTPGWHICSAHSPDESSDTLLLESPTKALLHVKKSNGHHEEDRPFYDPRHVACFRDDETQLRSVFVLLKIFTGTQDERGNDVYKNRVTQLTM